MTVNVQVTEIIDPHHWQHLTGWRERVFPEEGIGKQWTDVRWHIVAFAEEQPVAHLGFDAFSILVEGVELNVIGVGGVVVRPEYQGQGIPHLLFNRLHQEGIEKTGVDTYTLFCPARLVTYYNRYGYLRHEGAVSFLQHGERTVSNFEFMHRGTMATRARIDLQSPPW